MEIATCNGRVAFSKMFRHHSVSRQIRENGVLEYFETTLELMAMTVPELGPPIPDVIAEAKHDLDYRTHFERRSRKQEIPVYRVHFAKP